MLTLGREMPYQVPREEFDRLMKLAAATLPEQFRQALDVVRVEIRDRPTRRQLKSVGLEEDELLLGLYEGIPLTERSVNDGPVLPDVIYLFQHDIEDVSDNAEQLQEEVRITLLHELGHYFGLDEDELDELGFG